MTTNHKVYFSNSAAMTAIPSDSVALVVTSPPYPMIEMWDDLFSSQSRYIEEALKQNDGNLAFELMNRELDKVWDEVLRVLVPGGFACINIGDATRSLNGHFMCYPNHARLLSYMMKIGFTSLPEILWRKQSNAPNKFMGSGMLPAGAYVTQEHEYILIFRKGNKREFTNDSLKALRRESAFFWEERNQLFSDVWTDLPGTRQAIEDKEIRKRSAAFPFELPYRLINMYSVKGDTVLDPFFGLGTTMLAAMTSGRNSIGYEISEEFRQTVSDRVSSVIDISADRINTRLDNHIRFVRERLESGKPFRHKNTHYGFPVVTSQEKELLFSVPVSVEVIGTDTFEVTYSQKPTDVDIDMLNDIPAPRPLEKTTKANTSNNVKKPVQTLLFS